jgi:YD repeat-containing protein
MKRKSRLLLGTAIGAVFLPASVHGQETANYTYDPLGRLVHVATTGGPNNGQATAATYDPAGNRSNYPVGGVGGAPAPPPPPPSPPPPPPPPPPPSNNPPTPVADTGSQQRCTTASYNVTANDSDPDGDYPLTVTAVSGLGFSVLSGTTIQFTSGSSTGAKVGTYTVQDSRGATAQSTLTVTVSGGSCE